MAARAEGGLSLRSQSPPDGGSDFSGTGARIDHPVAIASSAGDVQVGLAHTAVEVQSLSLHAVAWIRAPPHAGQTVFGGQVEQYRSLRPDLASGQRVELLDSFDAQTAPTALVGHR